MTKGQLSAPDGGKHDEKIPGGGVGLSNILDSELGGRKPAEGPHGQVVGTAVVDSELLCEIIQRIEGVARIKSLLIFAVAALNLAVVPGRIRTNELVPNAQFGSRLFKQRRKISLAARKTVGKLKAVVRLDAFHLDP